VGLTVTEPAEDLVAGGPAGPLLPEGTAVAERRGDAGQGDHRLGPLGQPAVEAEAVSHGGAAQPTQRAAEASARPAERAEGGEELTGVGPLGAAVLSARTGPGWPPFVLVLVDLVLESGGPGVAEQLAALVQEEVLAGCDDAAPGSWPGCLFQLGGAVQG